MKEKNRQFHFDGLIRSTIDKYLKNFWDCVNNKGHVSINLLKDEDVVIKEFEGHSIIIFHIPRADRTQQPVYLTTNPYNGTYKRNDEGDYKCTEQEIRRMFADADDSSPRDSRILRGYTLEDDIDKESLIQYRRLLASAKPSHPWLVLDDMDLLQKLGGYRKNRQTKEEGFTVAGLLMFGKYDSIIDNECVPNYFPDYREIPDDTTSIRWTDRVYPDGTWETNLFQFYRRVYPKLTAVLPKPFKLENAVRLEDTPTHIAIREAFINSLVHADYSAEGNLVIEQHKDLFMFSNPGNMLISLSQYYNGGDSVCRNKSLQKMFMLIGSAEKAGSGVDKILAGWKEANWQKPYVTEKQRPDKVILLLPMESLLPQTNIDGLIGIFGNDIQNIGYNKLVTLSICFAEKKVSNDRLKVVLSMHSTEITKILKELCDDNILYSDGNGRGTYYRLKTSKVDTPTGKVDTPTGKVDTSTGKVDTSTGKVDTLQTKKHLGKKELEELILSCCNDYLSLEEIATNISREVNYLKNKIIPSMVKTQKLERLYPSKINHPNQKYKTTKRNE